MTLHVRYRFWYISLPSSAKQQREMIKLKVLCRTWTHDSEFSFFYLNCITPSLHSQLPNCLDRTCRQIERVETVAKKFETLGSHFLSDVFLDVAFVVALVPYYQRTAPARQKEHGLWVWSRDIFHQYHLNFPKQIQFQDMETILFLVSCSLDGIIGNLSEHDGDGWRERHKTKGLISKTTTLHVRYRLWYFSLPSSANNNVKWRNSKFYVEREHTAVNFFFVTGLFGFIRQIERVEIIAKKLGIFGSHF